MTIEEQTRLLRTGSHSDLQPCALELACYATERCLDCSDMSSLAVKPTEDVLYARRLLLGS